MPKSAILSICPDLTNANAVSVPLFRVSLEGTRLSFSYLLSFSEIHALVGRDNSTMGMVQFYPWYLSSWLHDVGPEHFFDTLVSSTYQSTIFVERLED